MDYLGNVKVVPRLPEELERLNDLAYNLYFSWAPEVRDLFIRIDRELWKETNHNPVKFLQEVQQKELEKKAKDPAFLKKLETTLQMYDNYLNKDDTWFLQNYTNHTNKVIAYFTAEFGFHESLPVYAGGLGVLAGDHIKSASDLGIPIVGVSLFYNQTYFTQEINAQGNQIAYYPPMDPRTLPMKLVKKKDGTPLLVKVLIENREIFIQIWKVQVGRVSVYLLDTNVPENDPSDRKITARLYAGNEEMRISQEIVLGMGGVLALKALGIDPSAWHMNEGHSVFLALQRIKNLYDEFQLEFDPAQEAVAINTIFTTHTPVPAGNDAFPLHVKDRFFQKYWESIGIRRHQFMELGSQIQPEGYEIFNLTILALNLSRHRNGVSQLHGEVSRKMWKTVWPDLPSHEVPISHITNGVHEPTWIARKMRDMFREHLSGDWLANQDDKNYWKDIDRIDDGTFWEVKNQLKEKLLNHLRERLTKQYKRNKLGSHQILRVKQLMQRDVLTIGFARRFATYKRGTLIFRDRERIRRILNDPQRPVQLIFAGKAHPRDGGGQDLIRQIHQISLDPAFRGKVVFVENYDMGLARDLISGVDVWLNTPRRGQEASGTSGEKASANGVLNFSVLDGWWCEGYNGDNGWAFGDNEDIHSLEELDSWDSEELYDILENNIIPLYYDRNKEGIPTGWIKKLKTAIKTILPGFNTDRMVKEYFQKMYIPAIELGEKYSKDDFAAARQIADWKAKIILNWSEVTIEPAEMGTVSRGAVILKYGETHQIEAKVGLGNLDPTEVKVQVYLTQKFDFNQKSENHEIFDMNLVTKTEEGDYLYKAVFNPSDSGNYQYTFRVIPYHSLLVNPVELGLAKWFKHQIG